MDGPARAGTMACLSLTSREHLMTSSRALPALLFLPLVLLLGGSGGLSSGEVTATGAVDAGRADGGVAGLDGGLAAEAIPGLLPPTAVPSRGVEAPITRLRSLPARADVLARARKDGEGRLVVPDKDTKGGVPLTIDASLQAQLTHLLKQYEVPYGAVVVLEPSTGRVLAMAEHSAAQPGLRGLSTRAVFPAASIFKIVTGTALVEAGVSPEEQMCYHGGKRRLSPKLLEDSARDGRCQSLADAMGKSANVIFAKMTQRYLSPDVLRRAAARFRFNREIAFPVPTDVSLASIPEEEFSFAETGAGFGDVYLSPLHGALVASVAANGGLWREPVLFEPPEGTPLPPAERVLSPEVAEALTDMLEQTVTNGTARRIFRERGFRVPGAVGKTGTLADKQPFRDYSWFVGFAPREAPRVAVAAVIVNEPRWRIRATWLGREAMRLGLLRVPAAPGTAPEQEEAPAQEEPPAVADEALDEDEDSVDEESPAIGAQGG